MDFGDLVVTQFAKTADFDLARASFFELLLAYHDLCWHWQGDVSCKTSQRD